MTKLWVGKFVALVMIRRRAITISMICLVDSLNLNSMSKLNL